MIYYVGHPDFKWDDTATLKEALDYCAPRKIVPLDTEFSHYVPEKGKLWSVQIGDESNQFVIDTTYNDPRELRDFLQERTILGQNLIADLPWLYYYGIFPKGALDTFISERVLSTGLDLHARDLRSLVERYVGVVIDKSEQKRIHKGLRSAASVEYAAGDIKYLDRIITEQLRLIKKKDLYATFKLEHMYLLSLGYMKYSGVLVDRPALSEKIIEDREVMLALRGALSGKLREVLSGNPDLEKYYVSGQGNLFGEAEPLRINWNAPTQVTTLFERLGINVEKFDKGEWKKSVEASVIERQDHPIIKPYLEYKGAMKTLSSYGENINRMICPSGRVYTSWTQIKNTGRISSGGGGTKADPTLNFQNIPGTKKDRGIFIPKPGYVFVQADYSQQENIILADQSKDPDLMNFFLSGGGDLHSYVAQKIFPDVLGGLTLDEVKQLHPDLRTRAKSATFALAYGGSGSTIADNLGISRKEGDRIYEAYMTAFPKLGEYFDKVRAQAVARGFVITNKVSKRKIFFGPLNELRKLESIVNSPGWWDKYWDAKRFDPTGYEKHYEPIESRYKGLKGMLERMGLNYPIQGTAADMVKLSGSRLLEHWRERKLLGIVLLPLKVHDEIIVECPEEMGEDQAAVLKKIMEESSRVFLDELTVYTDPKILHRWTKD